jgi:hypothetical protein
MRIELDIDIPEALAGDLREIAESRGRPVAPAEVERLAARLAAVQRASGKDARPVDRDGMLRRSVRCGEAVLHSPTYAAGIALRRILGWNEQDPDLFDQEGYDLVEAYILAHAYDREALARLTTPDSAAEAAGAWGVALTCTAAELREAVEALGAGAYPEPAGGEGPAGAGDLAEALDGLLQRYGGTDPERWLYDVPSSLVAHLADGARMADAKVARARAKATGEAVAPDQDPKFQAIAAYDDEVEKLKKQKKTNG